MTGIGGGAPGAPGEMTGLPIIGVRTLCKEKPFRVYKEQSDYAQWLFTIFDLELTQGGGPNQGPPGGNPQPGVPGFGQGKGKGKGRPVPQE